jgi:DNA-binding XRE family transcriptional regulator
MTAAPGPASSSTGYISGVRRPPGIQYSESSQHAYPVLKRSTTSVRSLICGGGSYVIREFCHRKGLSQEALSFAAGRHRTYVSLVERGRNSPSIRTLWVLAQALDVPPSQIIRTVEQRLGGTRRA